jgi:hypothetical protein
LAFLELSKEQKKELEKISTARNMVLKGQKIITSAEPIKISSILCLAYHWVHHK